MKNSTLKSPQSSGSSPNDALQRTLDDVQPLPAVRIPLKALTLQGLLLLPVSYTSSTGLLIITLSPYAQALKINEKKMYNMLYHAYTTSSLHTTFEKSMKLGYEGIHLYVKPDKRKTILNAQKGLEALIQLIHLKATRANIKNLCLSNKILSAKTYDPQNGILNLELTPYAKQEELSILQVTEMLSHYHPLLQSFFERTRRYHTHIELVVIQAKRAQILTKEDALKTLLKCLHPQNKLNIRELVASGDILHAEHYNPISGKLTLKLNPKAKALKLSILRVNTMLHNANKLLHSSFNKVPKSKLKIQLIVKAPQHSPIKNAAQGLALLIKLLSGLPSLCHASLPCEPHNPLSSFTPAASSSAINSADKGPIEQRDQCVLNLFFLHPITCLLTSLFFLKPPIMMR